MDEKDLRAIETLFEKQTTQFKGYLEIVEENFQHKLDLVVEGPQMLAERMDRLEVDLKQEIRKVDQRLTAVAADISAHRKDTEAHHGVYRIKEE